MLIVTATLPGRPDKREAIEAALSKAAAASRSEPGCSGYAFHRDLENPDRYVSVELWRDAASLEAHFSTPHIAELLGQADDLLDGQPVIVTYETDGPRA